MKILKFITSAFWIKPQLQSRKHNDKNIKLDLRRNMVWWCELDSTDLGSKAIFWENGDESLGGQNDQNFLSFQKYSSYKYYYLPNKQRYKPHKFSMPFYHKHNTSMMLQFCVNISVIYFTDHSLNLFNASLEQNAVCEITISTSVVQANKNFISCTRVGLWIKYFLCLMSKKFTQLLLFLSLVQYDKNYFQY